MQKKIIQTDDAPKAIGPYSQGVVVETGRFVFTAGQIALDPSTGSVIEGGIAEQTNRVLENIKAILKAAGSDLSRVVKTTVFLKDMNDFAEMNRVYGTYFAENPPARSAVEVARLPKDVLIEVECVASLSS